MNELNPACIPYFYINSAGKYEQAPRSCRRYRRQDEAGTPFCITVDGETIEGDGTVTIRDRDSLAQVRVAQEQVVPWLWEKLA